MLEAHGIEKVYRTGHMEVPVLSGVNLRIDPGAFLAITGPSGAGKSTLLHLLAGLDTPTRGEVLWNAQRLSAMSEGERAVFRNQTIGIVFQFYHLLPELTALENVMLPAIIHGGASRRELRGRASSCLEDVGLTARAQHRPNELSGGELQRAAIARALINHPQIIFCDEPTGNLDSHTGAQIAELLVTLHQGRQLSVVIVTHEKELAARASTTIVLRDGRIVEQRSAG